MKKIRFANHFVLYNASDLITSYGAITICLLFILIPFFLGCAPRIWTNYPVRLSRTKWFLAQGKEYLAAKELSNMLGSSKDRLLYSMELGMIYYLRGDFGKCIEEWLVAEKMIETFDRRPIVSVRQISEQIGTLAVNDYLITYQGMTYERVLLHIYLSLAYLMSSDMEEARVELKKAEQVQKDALRRWQERKYLFSQDSPEAVHIERELTRVYNSRYGTLNRQALNELNPMVYYLSGWLYDAEGYPDEALIDYKRIRDLGIISDSIAFEIDRLPGASGSQLIPKGEGKNEEIVDLLILYHQGLIPNLEELSIPIEIRDSVVMLSIPVYVEPAPVQTSLRVRTGDREVKTSEIVNVYLLAKESLRERALNIALRQAARMAFKSTLATQMYKRHGSLAGVFSALYNIFSEKADLRSWLTIPATIQISRMRLSPGRHFIDLYFEGTGIHKQIEIEAMAGEYKILDIHSIGSRIIIHNSSDSYNIM